MIFYTLTQISVPEMAGGFLRLWGNPSRGYEVRGQSFVKSGPRGHLVSNGRWEQKISKGFGQYAHSCPDRSMKRKFEKVFEFFVKTHRPSPKRSRGKKFSRIGDQTHCSCPVASVGRKFLNLRQNGPLLTKRQL